MLFEDFPPALQAAVTAYDEARRASHGSNEPAMSDTNKATIAPFIEAAVRAHASHRVPFTPVFCVECQSWQTRPSTWGDIGCNCIPL